VREQGLIVWSMLPGLCVWASFLSSTSSALAFRPCPSGKGGRPGQRMWDCALMVSIRFLFSAFDG